MKVSGSTVSLVRLIDKPTQMAFDEILTLMMLDLDSENPKKDTDFNTIWHLAGREEGKKLLNQFRAYLNGNDLTA
jgi:hypothetical protein